MQTRKKVLPSPLHLLHELSLGVVEHLESACCKAIAAAETIAGKQDKACMQAQRKLLQARLNLQSVVITGKTRVQARSRKRVAELEEKLFSLKEQRAETLQNLAALRRDAEQSILMAEGVVQVREAARQALRQRKVKHAVYRAGVPRVAAG